MREPPRHIALFTGNRSEYGLQYPIFRAVARDQRLRYSLLVGGAHLDDEFGRTVAEIEADGFHIMRLPGMDGCQNSSAYTPRSIASSMAGVSSLLCQLRPDMALIYGDRFESFGALIAATQMGIPTAHVEGGDYTEGGAFDDSVRHAMTKLAHLHFTTNEAAANRVRKLGEEPRRVFNVGLPSLDLVRDGLYAQPDDLIAEFGFDLSRPIVLFCQHSVATEQESAAAQVRPSLQALAELAAAGFQIVVTYPNDDAGGRAILEEIRRFQREHLPGGHLVASLGRRRFHGMLNLMGRVGRGVLAGNSSAGIKETPAFGCPTVNIGSRQHGRLRASNVVDTPYDAHAILGAIRRAAEDSDYREGCRRCENPYGDGTAGERIAEVLATIPLGLKLVQKKMTF